MGIRDAVHAEYGVAGTPVVTLLSCSLAESQIDITITPNSRLAEVYGEHLVTEQTNCNYGLEPSFAHIAFSGGLTVSAVDKTGEERAIERVDHPVCVAPLYHPQRTSRPDAPHPVWTAFVRAAITQPGSPVR